MLRSYFAFSVFLLFSSSIFGQACNVNVTASTINICPGGSVTLTASGATTYNWSPGNVTANSITVSPLTTTTYTVDGNCSGSNSDDTITIFVRPLPIAAFATPASICAGLPVAFTSSSSGTGLTYSWNFGDPASGSSNISTSANPSHTFSSAVGGTSQSFNVTLTVTSNFGCTHSVTNSVTVKQRPDASIADYLSASQFTNCGSGNFDLEVTNTSTTDATNSNYTISWGDGSPNFVSSSWMQNDVATHTYASLGFFNLVLTVTGTNGCSSTSTYSVYNGSNPAVGLGNPGGTVNLCLPTSLTFPITGTAGNAPGTTYLITTNTGAPSVTYTHPPPASYTHTFTTSSCGATGGNTANSFYVRIKAINPCGFSESTIEPITTSVKPSADISISPDTVGCVNTPFVFTNTSIVGISVDNTGTCDSRNKPQWLISPATGWGPPSGVNNMLGSSSNQLGRNPPALANPASYGSNTLSVPFSIAGTYTISMIVGNTCGNDTLSRTVCVEVPPVPSFTINPAAGCSPLVVNVTNNSTLTNQCRPAQRLWTVTKTSSTCPADSTNDFVFISGTNNTSLNPVFRFNNQGNYTITLALTNKCGTFTYTQTVTVKRKPVVTINPVAGNCGTVTVSPVANATNCADNPLTYLWTFGGGTPATSTLANPGSVSFSSVGTHTISLAVTNECGTTSAVTSFNITQPPIANAGSDAAICTGQSTTLSGSATLGTPGYTYSWSSAAGFVSSLQNPMVTPSSTTTYTLTVTDATGCSSTDVVVITVNPLPVITVNSPTICAGQTIALNASGATTYLWSTGASGSGISVNPGTTTSYTVTGTLASTGCSQSAVASVTVNPLPIVNAGSNLTLCNQPIAHTLSGYSPAGGTWSGSGVTAGGVFTPSAVGAFPLTYSYTDASTGCSNTSGITVTVLAPAIANAGTGNTYCMNPGVITLTGFSPAGGTWSGTGVSGNTFNPSTAGAGSFILTYTVGAGTCMNSDTIHVTVTPLPNVTVNSATICAGDSITLTATGATSFLWNTGASSATITISPSATTSYTVTGSSAANGCSQSAASTITVNPLPVVTAGADLTLCNQPIPYTLTGYSPPGGTWSGPGVTAAGVFTPSTAGAFTLTYGFTNASTGCFNSDSLIVTVVAPAIANAGTGNTYCLNAGTITLSGYSPATGTWSGTGVSGNTFNPAVAGVGSFVLTYSVGAGTCLTTDTIHVTVKALPNVSVNSATICAGQVGILSANGADSYVWNTGSNINPNFVSPATTTSYTVTGTSTLTNCSATATATVNVNTLPVVSAGSDVVLCNQPIPYTLTGYSPAGGTWSGTGVTAGGVFTPSATGSFTLTYTFTNASTGCSDSDSMVAIIVAPSIANAGTGNAYCLNTGIVTLSGYSPAGGAWSGPGISGNTFNPSTAGVGNFVLSYSYGGGTCLTTDTIHVTVNPLPTVTVNSVTVCAGQSATLTANGATTYLWSNGSATNPLIVSPAATTTYTVTGTLSSTGCTSTATSTVTVDPLPVVSAGNNITLCDQPISHTLSGYSPAGGTWSGPGVTAGGIFNPSGTGAFTLAYTFINQASGCSNSDTMSVFVITPVIANAGSDEAVCLNSGLLTLSGFTPAAGIWSGTGVTAAGVFDPLVAGVGTHVLTITYGAGTCFTQDSKIVTVKPLPVVNPGPAMVVCTSTPAFNLTGFSPAGGTWSGTGITNSTAGTFDPGNAGAGNFTLTYSYTDPITNCTDSSNRTITVGALPVVAFNHVPIGCVNTPIAFANTSTGAANYSWDFGDGSFSTVAAPSHVYTSAGIYQVKLIATSGLGCSDSLSDSIQIITAPVSDFSLSPIVGCAPLNVSFTNNSTGLYMTSSWNLGNGTTSSLVNAPAQIYNQGIYDTTYYITLSNTNLCGTHIHTDSVLVKPIPVVGFGTNVISGCSPLLITFNITSTGNASSYSWDFGDGSASSSLVNPSSHVFYTGTADTTYYITLTGSNICGSDTITKPILVHPNTVTSFFTTAPISGCGPLSVTFTNFSTGGSIYEWDFGDGNISTNQNATHVYTAPGVYTCHLYVNNGCSFDTSSVVITVNPGPSLSYTTDVNLTCVNQLIQFTNTSTGSAVFNWSFGDGTTSSLTNPSHSFASQGVYTVTLSGASTTFGCIDSISQTVTISALPIPAISASTTFGCGPLTVSFNNTSSNANFYSWNFDEGNTSATTSPTHVFNSPGTYNVVLVAENLQGCIDSVSVAINVYPDPIADFALSSPFSCTLPAIANVSNNSSGASSYVWNLGDGQTSNLNAPTITYNAYNTYQILLTAINTYGCIDTASALFHAMPTPVIAVSPDVSSGCEPLTVTFTNNTTDATTYLWQSGTGDTSSVANPAFTYLNSGSYNVTLTASNAFCSNTYNNSPIIVKPTPTANFDYEQVYIGDIPNGTISFNNLSVDANSYLWDFGDELNSEETEPTHQFPGIGAYSTLLTASNSYQCSDTAMITVIPDYFSGLFVPNALMPNNPAGGESMLFLPKGKSLRTYRLQIFDTWGIQLFESTLLDANGSPAEGWNGTSKGVECPQDVYVWKIDAVFSDGTIWPGKKYPNGKTDKTGTVTLIR
ncbi:MAG: hypothetical protein K0Q95_3143 [Bacteroidota bacterium]|jgi:PKD repeat protein|nr:hypothetical protein [Bacteroidota bacterium]